MLPSAPGLALAAIAGGEPPDDLIAFHGAVTPEQAHAAGVVGTHTLRFSRARVDPTLLTQPAPGDAESERWPTVGGTFAIEPFSGERLQVRGRRIEASPDGTWTWVGEVLEHEHADFVLTMGENGVFGTLRAADLVLEIQTGNDGWHYVREPDVAAYGGCAHEGEGHEHVDFRMSRARPRPAAPVGPVATPQGGGSSTTVDLLVLYSPAAASRYDIVPLINNAAAAMNASLFDSGVDGSVRVVHYQELTGYVEPSSPPLSDDDVQDLGYAMIDGDPPFSSLHQLRSDHNADAVHFIFDASKSPVVCGWGYIVWFTWGDPYGPYSLGGDECIASQNVFAHEIGHNLGGRHDASADPTPTPYEFSHGYSWGSQYQTIMGGLYCTMSSCSRLNRWSNPNQTYLGSPMGHSKTADMAASLDLQIPVTAAYETPSASTPGAPSSASVSPALCYGLNWVTWGTSSGTVGWYEVQGSTASNFSFAFELYRGPGQFVAVDVSQTTWVRVRGCNGASCGAWTNSSTQATFTNGCI